MRISIIASGSSNDMVISGLMVSPRCSFFARSKARLVQPSKPSVVLIFNFYRLFLAASQALSAPNSRLMSSEFRILKASSSNCMTSTRSTLRWPNDSHFRLLRRSRPARRTIAIEPKLGS